MTTPRIEENEYTSHEDLKEWEAEKDQNTLTQNIVALLGIHGMHCKFYEYQDVSHITKAFKTLIEEALTQAHQAGIDEAVGKMEKEISRSSIITVLENIKSIWETEPDPTAVAPKIIRAVEETLQKLKKF